MTTAVIDGLANAPVSGTGRALEAALAAGALAVGVVIRGQISAGPGMEPQVASTGTPLWLSVTGATVGVLGLAIAWGSPRRRLAPSVLLGWMSALVVGLATDGGAAGWLASLLAAALVGFSGALVAHLQGGSASIYTGMAILPPVLASPSSRACWPSPREIRSKRAARPAAVALAVAGGVTIGLALGRNLQALGRWFAAGRQRSG